MLAAPGGRGLVSSDTRPPALEHLFRLTPCRSIRDMDTSTSPDPCFCLGPYLGVALEDRPASVLEREHPLGSPGCTGGIAFSNPHGIDELERFRPCAVRWDANPRAWHVCELGLNHDGPHRCGCGTFRSRLLTGTTTERDPIDDELLRELVPTIIDEPDRVQEPESVLRALWGDR